jgi:hypothetical protein
MILRAALASMFAASCLAAQPMPNPDHWDKSSVRIDVPFLETAPKIDGDLSEWKYRAFTDGVWDIFRVAASPWYDPSRNRLTNHGHEPPPEDDLNARYYTAWDHRYLYLGAEVHDNVNDVSDPQHEARRWYFKDAICWFIEAPHHAEPDSFGKGDNAFCFVADPRNPSYGAWWRHGTPLDHYVEEAIPRRSVNYVLRMNPWRQSPGDFILEARVEMATTLGKSDPDWKPPRIGDRYGIEIVHTDPDGGAYGGHLIIYGTGDNDATWGVMTLAGPKTPIERKPE